MFDVPVFEGEGSFCVWFPTKSPLARSFAPPPGTAHEAARVRQGLDQLIDILDDRRGHDGDATNCQNLKRTTKEIWEPVEISNALTGIASS